MRCGKRKGTGRKGERLFSFSSSNEEQFSISLAPPPSLSLYQSVCLFLSPLSITRLLILSLFHSTRVTPYDDVNGRFGGGSSASSTRKGPTAATDAYLERTSRNTRPRSRKGESGTLGSRILASFGAATRTTSPTPKSSRVRHVKMATEQSRGTRSTGCQFAGKRCETPRRRGERGEASYTVGKKARREREIDREKRERRNVIPECSQRWRIGASFV